MTEHRAQRTLSPRGPENLSQRCPHSAWCVTSRLHPSTALLKPPLGEAHRIAWPRGGPVPPAPPPPPPAAPRGFSLQLSGSWTWPELGLQGGSGASCQDINLSGCSFPLSFTGSEQCEATSGDGHCYLAKANVLQGLSCQEKTQLKPLGLANFVFFLLPISLSLVTV